MFDHDFREIPSALNSPPAVDPPVKPSKPVVVTIPGLAEDTPLILAVEALRKLPRSQRNALLGHLMALLDLPLADRAAVAKSVQPHLTEYEVAVLCGVSVKTLGRCKAYQAVKPTLADYLETKRRRWYVPDEPTD